jgi:hypothetical protein
LIVIKIFGGLGNQMFQYAFGKALSRKLKTDLYLDLTWFENNTTSTIREFQLDLFNTDYFIADVRTINSYKPLIYKVLNIALIHLNLGTLQVPKYFIENRFSFNYRVNLIDKNCYVNGYWQSEKYFIGYKNELIKEFELKGILLEDLNKSLLNQIENTESVALHIRRSDFNTNRNKNIHGTLPSTYYQESMKFMDSNFKDPYYFIFSDDIEWAKKFIDNKSKNLHFVSKNPNYIDLYLNSKCKHNIIANSSFSWWGAWLNSNPKKNVIAPKIWFAEKKLNEQTIDLIPDTWIRI